MRWRNRSAYLPRGGMGVVKVRRLILNRKGLLGVDIGSAAVKVLELSRNNDSYRVESWALEPLPPGVVVEHHISDIEGVGEALRRAHARLGSRQRRVAVAVGGPALIAKQIALDAGLTDAEILNLLTTRADRYLPFALDEVAIDFEVLGLSEPQPDRVDVLLVACRQRSIDELRATLLAAGLKPLVVEPQNQAVERLFPVLAPDFERRAGESVVAIAEVGESIIAFWMLVGGRAIFNREQAMGGGRLVPNAPADIPKTVAVRDGADAGHADGIDFGGNVRLGEQRMDAPEHERTAVPDAPRIDEAVRRLSQSLRYFYSSTQYSDIDRLLLIGDAAKTPGLCDALQNALNVPVTLADPFANLTLAPGVDAALAENAPAWALCSGLAMRSCA